MPLGEAVDLPGKPGEEVDAEGLDVVDGCLWVVGSHSPKRKRVKPGTDPADVPARLARTSSEKSRRLLARLPLQDGPDGPRPAPGAGARLPSGKRGLLGRARRRRAPRPVPRHPGQGQRVRRRGRRGARGAGRPRPARPGAARVGRAAGAGAARRRDRTRARRDRQGLPRPRRTRRARPRPQRRRPARPRGPDDGARRPGPRPARARGGGRTAPAGDPARGRSRRSRSSPSAWGATAPRASPSCPRDCSSCTTPRPPTAWTTRPSWATCGLRPRE